jgi:hypothetical protein
MTTAAPAGSAAERRRARGAALVAQHPHWRGISHPERIFFPEPQAEVDPVLSYRAAVRRALERVHESQELYERVAAVAEAIDRRRWPWAASPGETPTLAARRRLPRLRTIRPASERPTRRRVLPTGRLLAH